MSDSAPDLFPCGPWTGFYNYRPGDRHRMDLHLTFANGSMTGEGNDDVGRFLIKGRYDAASRECHWTKTYIGAHDVFYRGFREGKGIWGTWEIGIFGHGGVHIWPRKAESGESHTETSEQSEPVDAVGKEVTAGVGASEGPTNQMPGGSVQYPVFSIQYLVFSPDFTPVSLPLTEY